MMMCVPEEVYNGHPAREGNSGPANISVMLE